MRPARDRHILEWTMGTIGIASLLFGAAMQTEPLRAFCKSGATPQMGVGEDCVQSRLEEALARAQRAETGGAAPVRPTLTGDALPASTLETSNPAPDQQTADSVSPQPSVARKPQSSQLQP